MAVPIIQLRARVPDKEIAERKATRVLPEDYVTVLTGGCDVYKPDGKPLCKLRKAAVSEDVADLARPHLRDLATNYGSDNRGAYAGLATKQIKTATGRYQTRTVDETGKSISVHSAIAGYFEPQGGRFQFCRMTAFVANEVEKWKEVLPLVHQVSDLYRANMASRFKVQLKYAEECSPDFRITGTPFSTITVNRNVAGSVHQDAGDLKEGFGVITCLRRGEYTGGLLCFPQYKVAADLEDRDMILFDPHEWHGVTDLVHTGEEEAERITVVYYFRRGLSKCGSAEDELEKVKSKGKL